MGAERLRLTSTKLTRPFVLLMVCLHLLVPQAAAEEFPGAVLPDPHQVSAEEFLVTVEVLERGFSGSGGYFLGAEQIAWLVEAEASLKVRGIEVQGEADRLNIVGDSYLNDGRYEEAVSFFTRAHNDCGAERASWLRDHAQLPLPFHTQVKAHAGTIPACASEEARLETPRYMFVAFFKGPVYRYDKQSNTHAIVFMPVSKYNWPEQLHWQDGRLQFTLREGQRYRFDIATSYLETLPASKIPK